VKSKFPFMEEWKEYRIGDVCNTISDTYSRGYAFILVLYVGAKVIKRIPFCKTKDRKSIHFNTL
jgi:hypothetical protein